MLRLSVFAICWFVFLPLNLYGQQFDEKFDHWPVDLTIGGRIIISSGSEIPENQSQALSRMLPGENVVAFFGDKVDSKKWVKLLSDESSSDDDSETDNAEEPSVSVRTLNGLAKLDAQNSLDKATSVVIFSGDRLSDQQREFLKKSRNELQKWIRQGGSLLVDQFVASELGKGRIDSKGERSSGGLNLIPDCLIKMNYESKHKDKMLSILKANKPLVGLGIAKDSLCVLSGRKFLAMTGSATFLLPDHNKYLTTKTTTLVPRGRRRRPQGSGNDRTTLIDLTQWRRMAIDRTLPQFPAEKPSTPFVKNGTLVIVGGGGMPRGLAQEIVRLAGGRDKAKMVNVPCSERETVPEGRGMVGLWKRMGIKHANQIHTKDRNKANTDKEFLKPLQDATGIWFGGGRQWNFSDSYYGTEAHKLMKKVLDRGGVIGGSSAGASIQGRYLARATPIGNFDIMAPGYERGGLGFLSGVAIDQHFSQRRRQRNMTGLVDRYPQLLGIGIDEATAIIVTKSEAKVVGRGRVFFYDKKSKINDSDKDYVALPAGSVYDLAKRTIITDSREKESPKKSSK